MNDDIRSWIVQMPKAEIHIHLEGSIGPATVLELAARYDKMDQLPGDTEEAIRDWMVFTGFPDFMGKYIFVASLLRSSEDFQMITEACGKDMAEQGIRYREITFTPYLHTDLADKGLTIEAIVEGLEAGRLAARNQYGVEMRWVFDIPRNVSFIGGVDSYNPKPAELTLEYALFAVEYGCVGFGLGGNEVTAPTEPFKHAFDEAKSAGLASLPHAGETMGAASVWAAIDALQADRIGHGVRSIEDPVLLTELRDRRIPLEVNLTSNICLHVYPSLEAHPFVHLDRMGLTLTINSDDPPFFDTTLVDEYVKVHDVLGYEKADLVRFARHAFEFAAIIDSQKSDYLAEFDRWVESDTDS